MALSPYINETVLTASIESVVPLNAQGILTQVIATSTYDLESGAHIYTVKVTDGVLQYQVGRKQAISASTCVGVSFSGRDGTATFDITPTAEGYTYKAASITNFYGSVNSDATLANKIYGPVESTIVEGEIQAGGDGVVESFNNITFTEKVKNNSGFWQSLESTTDPVYLQVRRTGQADNYWLDMYSYGHFNYTLNTGTASLMAQYGVNILASPAAGGTDYIQINEVTGYSAKLIHQGFGHIDYGQSGNEYGHTGGDGD